MQQIEIWLLIHSLSPVFLTARLRDATWLRSYTIQNFIFNCLTRVKLSGPTLFPLINKATTKIKTTTTTTDLKHQSICSWMCSTCIVICALTIFSLFFLVNRVSVGKGYFNQEVFSDLQIRTAHQKGFHKELYRSPFRNPTPLSILV